MCQNQDVKGERSDKIRKDKMPLKPSSSGMGMWEVLSSCPKSNINYNKEEEVP